MIDVMKCSLWTRNSVNVVKSYGGYKESCPI